MPMMLPVVFVALTFPLRTSVYLLCSCCYHEPSVVVDVAVLLLSFVASRCWGSHRRATNTAPSVLLSLLSPWCWLWWCCYYSSPLSGTFSHFLCCEMMLSLLLLLRYIVALDDCQLCYSDVLLFFSLWLLLWLLLILSALFCCCSWF